MSDHTIRAAVIAGRQLERDLQRAIAAFERQFPDAIVTDVDIDRVDMTLIGLSCRSRLGAVRVRIEIPTTEESN